MSWFRKKDASPKENVSKDLEVAQEKSWFERLKAGLHKTSVGLTSGIRDVLVRKKLDSEALEELEDLLISSDIGVETSRQLISELKKKRFEKEVSDIEVRQVLASAVYEKLRSHEGVWDFSGYSPYVMLMVGVNGSGKTTTLGKLANQWRSQGVKVCLAAGDTFRAAAVDQLLVWAERADVPVFHSQTHKDPAGLAYEALEHARGSGYDLLMIDTAGRLHTNKGLMDELSKVTRVLKKIDETAPHGVFLVIDATLGQNIHQQVRFFREAIPLTGLIVTKLDGTAKGGALISVVTQHNLPVMAIGVGESLEDLKPFSARDFSLNLLGLEEG